jgi:hypothetical protein
MRPIRQAIFALLCVASVAQAEPIKVTRQKVTKLGSEGWVDGHMRKLVRAADGAIDQVVTGLGGMRKARYQRFDFMGRSIVATFPNGVHLSNRFEDHRGTVSRQVRLEGGEAELSIDGYLHRVGEGTSRTVGVEIRKGHEKTSVSRTLLPGRRGGPAEIVSTTSRQKHEKGGAGKVSGPNLLEKDPTAALTGHLAAVRSYDAATTRSGRRALRAHLKRIDALLASGKGKLTHRLEEGLNAVTVEFPGGVVLRTMAEEHGSVSIDLLENGVSKRLFLHGLGDEYSMTLTTTRPKAYAHGTGEVEDKLYVQRGLFGDEQTVERSKSLTRPLKQ